MWKLFQRWIFRISTVTRANGQIGTALSASWLETLISHSKLIEGGIPHKWCSGTYVREPSNPKRRIGDAEMHSGYETFWKLIYFKVSISETQFVGKYWRKKCWDFRTNRTQSSMETCMKTMQDVRRACYINDQLIIKKSNFWLAAINCCCVVSRAHFLIQSVFLTIVWTNVTIFCTFSKISDHFWRRVGYPFIIKIKLFASLFLDYFIYLSRSKKPTGKKVFLYWQAKLAV